MRLSVQPSRRWWLTATARAAAILLLWLGVEYVPRLLPAPRQSAYAPGSADSVSLSPLELSVLKQPRALPEIRFADQQGDDLTLADFRGRVVLLNVWATWCVPCRQEMPTLDRLQARLGSKDFLVIALSIDRKGVEAVRGFYREVGVENLAIYVDASGQGPRALGVPGLPTTLLIDREGREVARKMGAAEWDSREMVSLVERTMRGQSASKADTDR
jgi:thiol-disulfide isomerase/thioredoxin